MGRAVICDCHYHLQHGGRWAHFEFEGILQTTLFLFLFVDGHTDGHFLIHGRLWERWILGLWRCHHGTNYFEYEFALVGDLCQVRPLFGPLSNVPHHDVSHLDNL